MPFVSNRRCIDTLLFHQLSIEDEYYSHSFTRSHAVCGPLPTSQPPMKRIFIISRTRAYNLLSPIIFIVLPGSHLRCEYSHSLFFPCSNVHGFRATGVFFSPYFFFSLSFFFNSKFSVPLHSVALHDNAYRLFCIFVEKYVFTQKM